MFAVIAGLLCAPSRSATAGSEVTVGSNVPSNQQIPMEQVDISAWDELLKKYVDEQGNVNYAAWKNSGNDVRALDGFLSELSAANPRMKATHASKIAFWINAYNAVTVRGILREYPTTSIRNHTAKLFGYNIWDDLLLTVGGKPYSLNQMEHEILRKMGEPRIHFAIVCASRSCPRLLNEAYSTSKLPAQLTANTHNFFRNRRNFRYDRAANQFELSSILKWFGKDFGDGQASQLRKIARYLPSDEARNAANGDSVSVSYLDYDWGLNEPPR